MLLCLLIQYCCISERLVRRFYKICFIEFASLTLIFVWRVTSLKFMLYCQNFDICRMHFLKVVFCKAFSRSFQVSRSFLLLIQNLATTFRHKYYFWISTQFVPHVLVALRLWINRFHLMFSPWLRLPSYFSVTSLPAAKKFLQKPCLIYNKLKNQNFQYLFNLIPVRHSLYTTLFYYKPQFFLKFLFPIDYHRLD